MYTTLLIRYGEIGLKGGNRTKFERRLMDNMVDALAEFSDVRVYKTYGRVFVDIEEDSLAAAERLQRVLGIVGISPVITAPLDMDAIMAAARSVVEVEAPPGDGSIPFRVDARRSNKEFPRTSLEINQEIGAVLLESFPRLEVNLNDPVLSIRVEIRHESAYVYARELPGPGGLPVGVSGGGLVLLSGGIDSPTAAWMAMKRGIDVKAIHFHSFPFTGQRSKEKVIDLCKVLAGYSRGIELYVAHFTEIQKAIQTSCPHRLKVIIMRRMMMRVAEKLARKLGALALITGESVAQVASQTLESIGVVNAVTGMPVLRPLIGMDKLEIIERAKQIGTYEISIRPYEDCCTVFVPKHPATRPQLGQVEDAERDLAINELVEESLEKTERVTV